MAELEKVDVKPVTTTLWIYRKKGPPGVGSYYVLSFTQPRVDNEFEFKSKESTVISNNTAKILLGGVELYIDEMAEIEANLLIRDLTVPDKDD